MKFLVIVKATPESEAGVMPSEQELTDMGNFNEELVKAGVMLAGEGLHPTSKGKRMRFSGSKRTVIDGPFTETKELVAGFWIWQLRSMERGNRMAQAQSVQGRRGRTPPHLRGRRFRCRIHARASRARGASARAGRAEQGEAPVANVRLA